MQNVHSSNPSMSTNRNNEQGRAAVHHVANTGKAHGPIGPGKQISQQSSIQRRILPIRSHALSYAAVAGNAQAYKMHQAPLQNGVNDRLQQPMKQHPPPEYSREKSERLNTPRAAYIPQKDHQLHLFHKGYGQLKIEDQSFRNNRFEQDLPEEVLSQVSILRQEPKTPLVGQVIVSLRRDRFDNAAKYFAGLLSLAFKRPIGQSRIKTSTYGRHPLELQMSYHIC